MSPTPEDLDRRIRGGNPDELIRWLATLDEAGRRALAPRALELRRRHDAFAGSEPLGHEVDDATRILVYATASAGELKSLSRLLAAPPRRAREALRLRPASFLDAFVPWFLERYGWWGTVRPLVREGLMAKPTTPWYTLTMIPLHKGSASELLRDDPDLLDDEVWRLFEIEGSGELSLAANDKYAPDDATWQAALVGVAAANPAHRERLLDASLAALERDMAAFRAGWFSRFHEALGPSLDERAARGAAYARLLRSPVRATVSFAVAALDALARASRLPSDGVVERLGVALSGASAGTARSALRFLERAGDADPAQRPRIVVATTEGLGSAAPEVQAAALRLLERSAEPGDATLVAALHAQASSVHASQRVAFEALLARLDPGGGSGAEVPSVAMVDRTAPTAPTSPTPVDPLDASRALTPIDRLDELVEVLTVAIETGGPADDIERALDGVSRLGRGGHDFERRTAPLAKRARTLLARRHDRGDPRIDIAALVLRWTRGEVVEPVTYRGAGAFLAARVEIVGARAATGVTRPLLAAPTHAGGWIDPRQLATRLASWSSGDPPDVVDAVAAMLRLGAAGRDETLAAVSEVRGEIADAVRHSLGGEAEVGPTAALWAAAARARDPGADDLAVDARHPALGPDTGRAARIELVTGQHRNEIDRVMYPMGLGLRVEPPLPEPLSAEMPTVLLLVDEGWSAYAPGASVERLRWEATIWPAWRESWSATGTLAIGRNIDWWNAEWQNRAYLEPLLDPWVEFGPMALTLVGVALGAKDPAERGLATDAAIAAMEDGRVDAPRLAAGLSKAADLGLARPRRWATALADVAGSSTHHARTVQDGAARAVGSLASMPAGDKVALLRLIHELVHQTGVPLTAAALAGIESVTGGGQARRLADAIVAKAGAASD
jgi:hypothetical protein